MVFKDLDMFMRAANEGPVNGEFWFASGVICVGLLIVVLSHRR